MRKNVRRIIKGAPFGVGFDHSRQPGRKEHPSHKDSCEDSHGNLVTFQAEMALIAFDEDADEHGNRDDLIAMNQIYETICPWTGLVSDERRSRKPGFWPFPHSEKRTQYKRAPLLE
jgi:hypothetical protein